MDAERERMIRDVWRGVRDVVDWSRGPVWEAVEPVPFEQMKAELPPAWPQRFEMRTLKFHLREDARARWVECEGVLCELRKK